MASTSALLDAGAALKLEVPDTDNSLSPEYMIESAKCFLCDHVFVEGDQPFLIFEKRIRDGQLECALSAVLSSALGRDVDETEAHSSLLCETCNSTVLEFESLEQRFCEIRYRILSAYNCTAGRNELDPIVFEINGVLQDGSSSVVATDDISDIAQVVKPEPRGRDFSDLQLAVDADAAALVEEVHEDMCEDGEGTQDAFDYVKTDTQQQPVVVNFSVEAENLTDVALDEQDMALYDELIEQTSQMCASEEAFTVGSQQDIEAYGTTSQSNSELMYNEADDAVESSIHDTAPNAGQSLFKLEGNRYCCLICKIAPPHLDGNSFAEHMRSAHKTPFYVCSLCHTGFAERQDLETHIDSQHCVSSSYECDTCERLFTNYRVFRLHKRSHYGSGKQYECSECHKKYSSKNLLTEHMNMHTGERPYKCSKCPKDFASKYTLKAHIKIHTERQRPYKCDECDKAFLNQQNLTQHKKLHVSVKAFVCDVCDKAFSTQHNRDVHKIVHSGQRPFICRTCGKSFARRADVKDHERIHTGERPFKCDMCPLAFAQRSNLTSHKKVTHLKEKLHRCEQCDRSFKRRRLLEYHMQAVHTGERPYKCQICNAGFVYPEHYKKHMIIHSGEKPYACEICGKQFNSNDNRKAHRFVHSEKKPYECIDCGAGFMRKPQLLAHIKHMKHSNDTIIVNQPHITGAGMGMESQLDSENMHFSDESVSGIEEAVETSASLEKMMQRAGSILAHVDNGTEDTDAITTVSGQLIKDELGAVKYLEFADLDGEGQEGFTWVDIGGNGDKV